MNDGDENWREIFLWRVQEKGEHPKRESWGKVWSGGGYIVLGVLI